MDAVKSFSNIHFLAKETFLCAQTAEAGFFFYHFCQLRRLQGQNSREQKKRERKKCVIPARGGEKCVAEKELREQS